MSGRASGKDSKDLEGRFYLVMVAGVGRRARLAKTTWESSPGAGQRLGAAHKP